MREKDIVNNDGMVSVIIPVYQAEKYIERCVTSVTNQTYKNLEIILVDDGSTDQSLKVCDKLAKQDRRIRVLHHENRGVAATRNIGLDHAMGEFVFFLDSDDWINENALYEMRASMEENNSDLCICGFSYVGDQLSKKCCFSLKGQVKRSDFAEKYFWSLYENAILFNIGTKLYKRSIIEENSLRFHEDMIVYEDIRFCLEYIDNSEKFFLLGNSYYYYFQGNTDSITHAYKNDFWRSTFEYCNLLISRFDDDSSSFKKAILLCLYRAYLQECHDPQLLKKKFIEKLEKYCFPVAEGVELGKSPVAGLSVDEKVFLKLISHKFRSALWLLARLISVRNK